jgi:broad specificity phosphatase PhoE
MRKQFSYIPLKLIIYFLWFVLIALFGCNGNGFQGMVTTDDSIGRAIADVELRFLPESGGEAKVAITNVSGEYKISLARGRYTVIATHTNYEDYSTGPGFFVVTGSGYQTGNILLKEPRVTTTIIVRHAEKGSGDNPPLTNEGRIRANLLAKVIGTVPISAIYSTDLQRTLATAEPTKNRLKLNTEIYSDPTSLAETIYRNHPGDTVLVVGHSNTIPQLIEAIGGHNFYSATPTIEDFDNLFIVYRPVSGDSATVLNLQYGADSSPDVNNLSRDGETTVIALLPAEASGSRLTQTGVNRANALPHILGKSGISAIYSENIDPALLTVGPLASVLGKSIIRCSLANINESIRQIETEYSGDTILVAASRSVLQAIINQIGGYPMPVIDPYKPNIVLVIRRLGSGNAIVSRLEFDIALALQ